MRKLISLSLALALALGLTACGGKAEKAYATEDVRAMADAGAFSEELEELDADIAFVLYNLADYGLAREELTDCAVLRSAGATCEECAVLVFGSADKAETAAGALEDYIQSQIEANRDYRPDEIPKLEDAYISQRGSTLLLVVASDMEAAKKAVE